MQNIKFGNPPFKLSAHYVYDSEDQFCFQFDLRAGHYEDDEKIMKEVIDILNSRTDRKVISKLDIIDGYKIHISDRPFITIRGWGRLTGCGGGLCLDTETAKEIPDNYFDCCVTDPPYRIIAGGVRKMDLGDECSGVLAKRDYSKTDPKGCLNRGVMYISDGATCSNKWIPKNSNTPSAVKNGKMFDHNDIKFSDWLGELYRVMKEGTHTYIMINGRNLKELQIEAEKAGFKFQNLLVWAKGNLTPNKYYMQGAEFILMLRKGRARNINNMGSSNVIKIPNIIGKKKHPTEKPVELYEYLLKNSTNPQDKIIDPFAGCGNIVIAGNNLGLHTTAIEIDEKYFNIFKNL